MNYITEQEIDTISNDTARRLAKEKRVLVTVEPEYGEKYWEGGVNGCFFRIKTGVPVSVPKSLADLIAASRHVRRESSKKLASYEDAGARVG